MKMNIPPKVSFIVSMIFFHWGSFLSRYFPSKTTLHFVVRKQNQCTKVSLTLHNNSIVCLVRDQDQDQETKSEQNVSQTLQTISYV